MRFSLVVPAHNEERYLPALLDSVDRARGAYVLGPAAVEVVVADNASTDRTADVAMQRGCRVVTVGKRRIAAARNAGARSAQGTILAFVDADTRIHPDTFAVIEEVMKDGRIVGGATGVTMERWSAGIALTYAMFLPLVWLTRMDSGVVFCRREDFEAVGGYDESRLYAEDVAFLWALRRLGRARRQRLARVPAAKAVTSARKFDRFGDWHYFRMAPRFFRAAVSGGDALQELADQYWYRRR